MQLLPAAVSLLFAEVDGAGERLDQARGEEIRGREVEDHLLQVPLREPHRSDDQGPLAHHEEAGNALKWGAFLFLFFGLQFVFWKLDQSAVCGKCGEAPLIPNHDLRGMQEPCLPAVDQCAAGALQPLNPNLEPPGLRLPCPPDHCSCWNESQLLAQV